MRWCLFGGGGRASALETHIREGHFIRVINVLSEAPQRLFFAGVSKFGLVHDSFPLGSRKRSLEYQQLSERQSQPDDARVQKPWGRG